ncbi:glutathione S-transferase N-terminal domain-containing protein [Saccharospirillum sp.]|uniref:glutathione S-transferase N-terminal domain-containing protein n=1 Tax=Saccharospirillum sp. TaxID=2033801 RepID=UPI00349FE008
MIEFPKRWPANNPDILQLYSMATPNGQKIGIMLEETGLPYEAHLVNITKNDQFDEDFLKLNPNNKIPAIIDPDGPDGQPMAMMESGAILMYLAEKTGQFLPKDPAKRWETLQWMLFQVAHVGPMFGQFGHFYKFAADKTSDNYGVDRYTGESKRILEVLNQRLQDRNWIMGDELTIADMAIAPWIKALDFYDGHEALDTVSYKHVLNYRDRFYARPAVQTGAQVCRP